MWLCHESSNITYTHIQVTYSIYETMDVHKNIIIVETNELTNFMKIILLILF